MSNPHEADLLDSNRKLLSTSEYYDLTITCGDRTWRVHRSIICKRSEFFAAACNKKSKDSASNESELETDDPRVFERLLHYLYLLNYQDDIPLKRATVAMYDGDPKLQDNTSSVSSEIKGERRAYPPSGISNGTSCGLEPKPNRMMYTIKGEDKTQIQG